MQGQPQNNKESSPRPNTPVNHMEINNAEQLITAKGMPVCKWFVPKVSVLIFLCMNWQSSTLLMCIGTLVVTLAACPYLFQLDWLSQSCTTAVCVWSCFLTSLHLQCRKISNNGTLSNFV